MSYTKSKYGFRYVRELARSMRHEMTEAEKILWEYVRNKKLSGLKFKRQYPIGRYVADFFCYEKKLIIEIDGSIHESREEYDKNRDEYLTASGYEILRIKNDEIIDSIETVIEKIKSFV